MIMNRILVPLFAAMLLAQSPAFAVVTVKTEQLNPADPAWNFKTMPRPSKSDLAAQAAVTIAGNQFDPAGADGSALVNGVLPASSLDLPEEVLLSNANADGGNLVIDLGRVQPVAAVASYSWHEWDVDQGARGPQVFALSGSADGEHWTKLAEVDTRPNRTGEKWGGQHGAFISDTTGKLGDFRYLSFALQRTRSPLQPNPGLTGTLFAEIDVHSAATLAKAGDAVVSKPVQVTDVWVAFKTHFDIGYTDPMENVLRKYRGTMMENALKIIEQDRQLPPEQRFAWMLPGWGLKHILGPLQDPARKVRIEQAIREGALYPGAIPASLHSETEDLEDLVRGVGYASKIARDYGRPLPVAAKMTDVPCHSWIWPTLLANAGVQVLQLGCNGTSGHLRVPHLFWWEGADGSRVLCNFTPQYGSEIIPPHDWPAKNYLAMIMTADNHGPPTLAEVEHIRKLAAEKLPGVHVHFGTLDDFTRAVIAEKPELPVVRGDMPDTWIYGWMSMPIESGMAHTTRAFQPALETLDTQLRAWGISVSNVAPALADAYEQSILYSEHTFGPWGPKSGPWETGISNRYLYGEEWQAARASGAYKKYEAAFDDKRAYARKENEIISGELKSRLDLLAQSVDAGGGRTVVYNALPWPRSGMVEVDGTARYVENVPANGYKTLSGEEKTVAKPDENTSLETPFYKVAFDLKRGGIASLIEKKTGRELVDKTSPYALGQFMHERFDAEQMLAYHNAYGRPGYTWSKGNLPKGTVRSMATPPAWKISVQHTVAADIATLTATDTLGLAKGYDIVITLPRQQPFVDVEWRVTGKTPDPLPEGGWLCFPFAVKEPQFKLGRLGGPIDPAKDIVTGANKTLICLNTGLTITGPDNAGVGLCPINSPCVSLGKPGLWQYSFDYVPQRANVFVNLYNNEWNTNFPEWQEGSWSSRVRIWPTTDLAVPSWEARVPLLAAVAKGPAGKLPKTQTGLSLSRPGVLVTAFGQNPDGQGTLLRVWDQSGESGKLVVKLPGKFKTATPVNLRGEKTGEPFAVIEGTLNFNLGMFAPASFVME